MGKRGQSNIGMPFGMIFSIFLIVVFFVVAFIAVRAFLDVGDSSSIGLFYEELQDSVDAAWQSQSSQRTFEVSLPSSVKMVCFANLSKPSRGASDEFRELEIFDIYDSNVFLLPLSASEGLERKRIDHLDIDRITSVRNPYCVSTDSDLLIKKDFYDKLVTIE